MVLEYEMARYPAKDLSTKKKRRLDEKDHLLDCAEHICAMHPKALKPRPPEKRNPIRAMLAARRGRPSEYSGDPMLGG